MPVLKRNSSLLLRRAREVKSPSPCSFWAQYISRPSFKSCTERNMYNHISSPAQNGTCTTIRQGVHKTKHLQLSFKSCTERSMYNHPSSLAQNGTCTTIFQVLHRTENIQLPVKSCRERNIYRCMLPLLTRQIKYVVYATVTNET